MYNPIDPNVLYYLLAQYKSQDSKRAARLECQYSFVLDALRQGTLEDWDHVEALFEDLTERLDG